MTTQDGQRQCTIYTRKSTDEGLEQDFNSLDAQRESAEAFIASQANEGWIDLQTRYDDGGYSGGNMERPALKRLLADIDAGEVDCVVVYKIDRLSRSLLDFARIARTFEERGVSFVAVTQQFNSTTSMGRLMMNVLLSFAQFERELASERTRDKIAASRRKGKWTGGHPALGYDVDRSGGSPRLVVNEDEAGRVRAIFELYLEVGSLLRAATVLDERGWRTKVWETKKGRPMGGKPLDKTRLYNLLTDVVYAGKVRYRNECHDGEHEAIVPVDLWRRVQARLQHNGRSGGTEARNKHGALLRGLLHCGPCGCSMTHTTSRKNNRVYRYYKCERAQKLGARACPSRPVPAAEMERFVIDEIRCIGRDPGLVVETLREAREQAETGLERLARERAAIERELSRDEAALRRTDDPAFLADLHERIASGQRRLRDVAAEIGAMRDGIVGEDELRAALADFDGLWSALAPREQVRVIQLLVERVVYDGIAGTVSVTFRPTGIRALETGAHREEAAA